MNKKLGIVLVLATALILSMVTIVSASRTYTVETVMLNMEAAQSTSVIHWTGEDAKSLAEYIDTNYYLEFGISPGPDGRCTFDELERYRREKREKPEKEKGETENTFIDGIRGNIIDVDCDAGMERGWKDYEEEITITCTYTMKWNLEDKNEHVYSRVGLDDNDAVSFTVPKGWIISSVEDLKGNSTSSDKRTVSGLAITGKTFVIRFTKAPVPTPSPSPSPTPAPSPSLTPILTPSPTPTPSPEIDSDGDGVPDKYDYAPYDPNVQTKEDIKTPGFRAIFAIVSVLAVAFGLRRRRKNE